MRLITIIIVALLAGCSDYGRDSYGHDCLLGDRDACRSLEIDCQNGDAKHCLWLGYVNDAPDSIYREIARRYFERACGLGNATACRRLNP
jgi:hypothetical protein